jgi:hypothetical protein
MKRAGIITAVVVALGLGLPFRAPRIELLLDSPHVDELLETAATTARDGEPLLVTLGRLRDGAIDDPETAELATAMLGWAAGYADLPSFVEAILETRARLPELRRDDAPLTLATAHATKGLEFDHVVVVGMEIGRFPSARAVGSAEDPVRACEEERRLAYVAWTRARRSLTLLYDPAVPSRSCSRRSAPMSSGSAPRPAEFAHERLDLYPEARKPVAFTGPTSVDEGDVGVKGSTIRITPPSDTRESDRRAQPFVRPSFG